MESLRKSLETAPSDASTLKATRHDPRDCADAIIIATIITVTTKGCTTSDPTQKEGAHR